MSVMIRPLFALTLTVALAACNKSDPPAKPALPTTPTSTAPAVAAPAPAASAPENSSLATTTVASTASSIGVAECDDYLTRYEACMAAHVPEAVRGTLQQSLAQTRDAWRAAATTDAGKQGLAMACKQAHDASRTMLQQYGCSDF